MNVDFIITPASVDNVVEAIRDETYGERSLRYCRFLGVPDIGEQTLDDRMRIADRGVVPAYQSRMAAAFGDRSPSRQRAVLAEMRTAILWNDDADATMDSVTAAWLEALGLSPADLYMLSSFSDEMHLVRRDGTPVNEKPAILVTSEERDEGPSLVVCRDLAPHCWWADGQLNLASGMIPPRSAVAAGVGRPLREVFSHPFLDPHDLTIVAWNEPDTIVTDAVRVRVFPKG